jgi:hypothetical protein
MAPENANGGTRLSRPTYCAQKIYHGTRRSSSRRYCRHRSLSDAMRVCNVGIPFRRAKRLQNQRCEKIFQESLKNAIASLLLWRRPLGT